MKVSQIDEAIVAAAQPSWRKVALIVAVAAKSKGVGVPDDDEGHRAIAARIEALVRDGRLTAQGDLKKWRHSEVRLP